MNHPDSTFDAIIVGARVAGSAVAIALARRGLKILLVDKAAFPADTLSTHIVLAGGTRVLARMNALEHLERAGARRYQRMRMLGPGYDYGVDLEAAGGDDLRGFCLSRTHMDAAMLALARDAGAAVRERLRLTDLVIEDGAVAGIRGEDDSGTREFHAALVIGADGMRSTVARIGEARLGAFARTEVPCARAYYYAYFDDLNATRFGDDLVTELDAAPGQGAIACRCENGRAVAAVAFDADQMRLFRTDLEGNFQRELARSFAVGHLVEGGRLASRIFSSGGLRNTCRKPVADGALLVGDAGLHVDPLFGQGHSLALMSAEIVGELAPRWFSARRGRVIAAAAMSEYALRRDRELLPYYAASVKTSRALVCDPVAHAAHQIAQREGWAALEMARFGQMAARGAFPSFRFARMMARHARAA
ncbi:MAG TPA: NAD(P)/FAD-dependent oxidoreductase [Candidatus Binataceae bacterium]|nr:NAD(P)/FAD-dependent oxidoreductase [Candidatus Binataceae bacterium]